MGERLLDSAPKTIFFNLLKYYCKTLAKLYRPFAITLK